MKTSQFKVGDKVMLKVGGRTIDCVAVVRYRFLHEGKPGSQLCFLELVGKDNPEGNDGGWPSTSFHLMWSGDKATH